MNIETLTVSEEECLLYVEECCVDRDGYIERRWAKASDLDVLEGLRTKGLVQAVHSTPEFKTLYTHHVSLSEAGWVLAHTLRRRRAQMPGPVARLLHPGMYPSPVKWWRVCLPFVRRQA